MERIRESSRERMSYKESEFVHVLANYEDRRNGIEVEKQGVNKI